MNGPFHCPTCGAKCVWIGCSYAPEMFGEPKWWCSACKTEYEPRPGDKAKPEDVAKVRAETPWLQGK